MMAPSFDYNDQNAFRCNLRYADTEYNSLPQSILVLVVICVCGVVVGLCVKFINGLGIW